MKLKEKIYNCTDIYMFMFNNYMLHCQKSNLTELCPDLIGSLDVMRYQASRTRCHTDNDDSALFSVTWIGRSPKCSLQRGTFLAYKAKDAKFHVNPY